MLITAPRVIPATGRAGLLAPGYVSIADGRITGVGAGPPPGTPDLVLAAGILLPA